MIYIYNTCQAVVLLLQGTCTTWRLRSTTRRLFFFPVVGSTIGMKHWDVADSTGFSLHFLCIYMYLLDIYTYIWWDCHVACYFMVFVAFSLTFWWMYWDTRVFPGISPRPGCVGIQKKWCRFFGKHIGLHVCRYLLHTEILLSNNIDLCNKYG